MKRETVYSIMNLILCFVIIGLLSIELFVDNTSKGHKLENEGFLKRIELISKANTSTTIDYYQETDHDFKITINGSIDPPNDKKVLDLLRELETLTNNFLKETSMDLDLSKGIKAIPKQPVDSLIQYTQEMIDNYSIDKKALLILLSAKLK